MFLNDKINKDTVRVVVFGPGFGESIILYIPRVGWGVVDSCLPKVNGYKRNPALEYLKTRGVQQLAFLILTHPHKDHYLGLDQIIDHFLGRIERICYYSGNGVREYRTYLSRNQVLGERGLRGLGAIFEKFEKAKKAGSNIVKLGERTEIIRKRKYGTHEVEIVALSPSAESVRKYVEILFSVIPKVDGDTVQHLSDREHNLLSSAVWCSIGNVRLILGSDVEIGNDEQTGWKGILKNIDCPDLSAQLIKVSHHGSPNAFYEPAWEMHSRGTSPVSIIAPYNRLSKPLPGEKDKERIAQYSTTVAITSSHKFVKPKRVYDRTVVKKLHGVRDWKCLVEHDCIGHVTVDLSIKDGIVEKLDIAPPAYSH